MSIVNTQLITSAADSSVAETVYNPVPEIAIRNINRVLY